jgi:hypothetical protein
MMWMEVVECSNISLTSRLNLLDGTGNKGPRAQERITMNMSQKYRSTI